MDKLPDELVAHIISFLDTFQAVKTQHVSRRFLRLARDNSYWKSRCFADSRGRRRKGELFAAQDASLAELRNAMMGISSNGIIKEDSDTHAESRAHQRAIANWDPSYPAERLDYYQSYITRNAPIAPIGWLQLPPLHDNQRSQTVHEATGIGALSFDVEETANGVVAPLEDGSICMWDVGSQARDGSGHRGRLLGRSAPGLLSGLSTEADKTKLLAQSKTVMTETGAVECVSIDSTRRRGFFAVQNKLHEVDLATFQIISQETYPFAITALSEAKHSVPVTVGTNSTVHIHDSRSNTFVPNANDSIRCELISGPTIRHAVLAQPGPLSILHHSDGLLDNDSIWVAGRFTPLLVYDRRFFPRLLGTVHSGARISCLASLPHPHIPRSLDLLSNPDASIANLQAAKSVSGTTLLAAGVYKGKGSLELYGIGPSTPKNGTSLTTSSYQNRQTASSSKLLSVASHNASIVYSDGDGNLKWVERDGSTPIRSHNINEDLPERSFNQAQTLAQHQNASDQGIWSSSASEIPGQGDIAQKIITTNSESSTSYSRQMGARRDVNTADLLIWTGDGRIGLLGFGHSCPIQAEVLEEKARSAEEMALEDAERQLEGTLRRALVRQANEARIMQRLGQAFQSW